MDTDGVGSCQQARNDLGALGVFTTTYEQNDEVRSGGTSFAIYSGNGVVIGVNVTAEALPVMPSIPVPTLSIWALWLLALSLAGAGFLWHRRRTH